MAVDSTIDNTYGVLYVAVVISAALYGTGMLQFWMYIRKYHSRDSFSLQAVVVAVIICDTVQEALICHGVYKYLVTSIANPPVLTSVVDTLMIEIFFSCAIATLVQQFYCWRIWRIGRNVILTGAVSMQWAIAASSLTAGADVVISITLVVLLHASKTGFKASTDLINRLMIFSFNTGLPTSFCALMATICVTALPNTCLYILFFLLLGRFYTNSLLVTLNSRGYIRSPRDTTSKEQYSLESSGRGRAPIRSRDHITVRIDTDTMQDYRESPISSSHSPVSNTKGTSTADLRHVP
ncbi:hypothetical protein MIND_00350100 [Mycena indigotica]|uniref:DUF6534 domain-containing protein n=1 Tax=Mycena indigotica TaxID=2126181 RepID=A0A8H6W9K0_9AGAR|nr:uncharacterized protein MIND_00350100 [Mycena indigotica]KAF7309782.1 hypothetical protein MIND_00350100 [Mycena indigotica]